MENYFESKNIEPEIAAYLLAMRSELAMLNLGQSEQSSAMGIVDQLEMQFESQTPDQTLIKNLVSSLPTSAMLSSLAASLLARL